MTCVCGHQPHGPRVSRGKPHREVALGCLADDCDCENYVAGKGNNATMPADFHRALSNLRREFNEKLDRLKAQYLNQ